MSDECEQIGIAARLGMGQDQSVSRLIKQGKDHETIQQRCKKFEKCYHARTDPNGMIMTIEQAFELVMNLDYKETHRRFAPQHGLLQFNSRGEVVSVYRYKTIPHEAEQNEALSNHPGCLQISTMPHWFVSADALQARIAKELWLFSYMKPKMD